LVIVKSINLYQVYSLYFQIKHLDSSIIKIIKDSNDSLYLNESIRKVVGKGMPVYKKNNYGDLFVRFTITIPKTLGNSDLELVKNIFNKSTIINKYEVIDSDNNTPEFKLESTGDSVSDSEVSDVSSESEESEQESQSGSDNISNELNEINSDSD